MLIIRKATRQDLPAITDIYNEAIQDTTTTFDINTKTLEEQEVWFNEHVDRYQILVAQRDNTVIGWASLSEWSDRRAYAGTAEISVYVKEEYQRKGAGKKLSEAIVRAGREAGLHTLIARIAEGNDASIRMAESLEFKHIGVMKEVGRKFDKLLDVYMMQLIYK